MPSPGGGGGGYGFGHMRFDAKLSEKPKITIVFVFRILSYFKPY